MTKVAGVLFDLERFDSIDRLLSDWSSVDARDAQGRWKLEMVADLLPKERAMPHGDERTRERLEHWRVANPKSVGAALFEAEYWRFYARKLRPFDDDPPPSAEAQKLYRDRARHAEKALIASKSFAAGNPLWGKIYLDLADGLGWSEAKRMALFRDLTAKHKNYYPYFYRMVALLAKKNAAPAAWQDVARFVEAAVATSKEKDATSLYAKLYWRAARPQPLDFDIFQDAHADWPRMKQSFEDLMQRYPHSAWNMNAFACRAGDGETFRNLRFRIANTVVERAWPSNLSIDVCEAKFGAKLS